MSFLRLVKRNILVYTRDKANVFFSLLSMIIIILLMSLFLGSMNVDNIINLLEEYGGSRDLVTDRQNARNLIILWSVAGIIVVNSVSITLAMVGNMVEDQESNKMSSFLVTPLNRSIFVMAYITAAFVVGVIMCTFTLIISQILTVLLGGALLSLGQIIKVFLLITINVFTFASLGLFMVVFIRSRSAFAGLSTIVGTLVGFLAAIYIPIGSLPSKVQMVIKCIPLLHGSSLIRSVFSESALESTFSNCPPQLIDEYSSVMGITINWNNKPISSEIKVLFLLTCGIIFIITSAIILKKRNALDR